MYVYSKRDENPISNFGNETRKQVNKFLSTNFKFLII